MPTPLLEAVELHIAIAGKAVCQNLDLSINPGECWAILGSNGIGKSTLLLTLAGLRRPTQGAVLLEGRPILRLKRREVAQKIGVLFQEYYDSFPTSVLEAAMAGRHPYLHTWQWERSQDYALARQALRDVELAGIEDRDIRTLSGGERRRVAIAMMLTQNPQLFLLDEPTNHLDLRHRLRVLAQVRSLVHGTQRACVTILQDIDLAQRFCDQVLLLFGAGETLQGNTQTVLNCATLERLYSHPMLRYDTPAGPRFVPR